MSDEQQQPEADADGPAASGGGGDAPKDLPVGIVVAAIVIAAVIFGIVGWQRYKVLNAELMREAAAGQQRAFEEGVAEAHRLAAEKDAETQQAAPADADAAPAAASPQTAPTPP